MPGKSKKGGGLEVKSSAYTPYKMKGSPMQRNFGIGTSPMKDHMDRPHEHVSEHVYTINDPKTGEKVTLTKDPKGRGYEKGKSTIIKREKIRSTLPTVEVKGKKKEREEASPMEFDLKETLKKGWDKATQIGMGIRGVGKEFAREIAFSDYGGPTKDFIGAAKRGYQKEKAHDEAGGGLGTYKKKKREQKTK